MEKEKKKEVENNEKVEEIKETKDKKEEKVEEGKEKKKEEKMAKEDDKVKEDKKQEKEETKEKKKSGKKAAIMASVIILVVLIVATVGGYFAYEYIELKKPIEQEWADTYYNYIKGSDEESRKIQNNSKIGFIEVSEVENPVMIVEYEKDERTYTDIYYINDGTVNNVINLDMSNVELVYDISTKKYDWYTHTETDTTDTYKKVSTQILGETIQTTETEKNTETTKATEYTFTKGEEISVDTVEGDKIAIPKFDTVFVKTDIEIGKVEYSEEMSKKELKSAIIEGGDKYKTKEEMITEEVKTEVMQKVAEVENKKQEMEIAKEEKAKKEEEEMKITAENVQAKIGEHLKWASLVYLGADYGLPTVYQIKDVTGTVSIPGTDSEYLMTEEIVGLKSIQSLKNQVSTYLSSNAINKLNNSMWGSYTEGLKEYNGKVYIVRGGIGDGPSIDIKKAKVLSSENGISKIQLTDVNVLGDIPEATITLTLEYNKDTGKYLITDVAIKGL